MAEDPYVYPGTNVLRNHFDLRDPVALARREDDTTTTRIFSLRGRPLSGRYDFAHLKAFHRHIFGDVYSWAGQRRTVPISKGSTLFALPDRIEPYLSGVLDALPREKYLRGMPADRLAYYLAEINAAHPFREGNGRTQRAFIGQLAAEAGYHVAWENLTPDRNIATVVAAMRGDNSLLREAIAGAMAPAAALDDPERSRLRLAHAEAKARFDALSDDPDDPALLQASFDAQRNAERLELDSRPQWLTDTLGERPADRPLAQQWEQLGVAIIRLRERHGITDEIDNGSSRADLPLKRSIGRFRVLVGLDQPSPGTDRHRGRGITD
jgi:cell filamentation protein